MNIKNHFLFVSNPIKNLIDLKVHYILFYNLLILNCFILSYMNHFQNLSVQYYPLYNLTNIFILDLL